MPTTQTLYVDLAQPRVACGPMNDVDAASTRGNPLSTVQIQRYREEGYLVVADGCDPAELARMRSLLMDLFWRRSGRDEGNHFDMLSLDRDDDSALQPQIVKPSLYAPALLHTAHFRRSLSIARQLLGDEAHFSFDHSILKPAGHPAATPWHQDEAHHHDPEFHRAQLSVWMPLQDVSEHNGCMCYVPGSHRGALLPHHSLYDDPRIHAIECPTRYFDESAARAQPVAAGWSILHDGRTLHSALPNRSDADRLVYVLAFRGIPVARPAPAAFAWLDEKRSANLERSLQWRRHGGDWVLRLRRARRLLGLDLRVLISRLRKRLWGKRAIRGCAADDSRWF